jgi:two-component sensor histidine kinase
LEKSCSTSLSYGAVSLEDVVRQALAPSEGGQRLTLSGPPMTLPPKAAMSFGMILDELATNAVKFGALANSSGRTVRAMSRSTGLRRRDRMIKPRR